MTPIQAVTEKQKFPTDFPLSDLPRSSKIKVVEYVNETFDNFYKIFGLENLSKDRQKIVIQTIETKKGECRKFFFFQPQPVAKSDESAIFPLIKVGKKELKPYVLRKGHTLSLRSKEQLDLHQEAYARGIAPKMYTCKNENDLVILKFMNQGDLCQFLSQKSDLSRDARLGIAYEVVYIIYQLHEEMHIYHRDIKLENFLVDTPEEGVIKISITDFGFATKKPFANDFKGTLDYCAPESLPFLHNRDRLHFYDLKQADLYSLGATVYSLLAGKNLDEQLKKIMSKDKSRDTLESTRLELIQKNLEHYPKEVIDSVISLTNPLAGARPTTIDVLAVFEKLFPQDGI